MKPMKVLVVDDSLLFREIAQQELERDVNVQVVAKAADAFEASKKIVAASPDVLLVDVMMDRMDGLQFVRQLLPQYYLPVIMVSSNADKRQEAESIGNITFFAKPGDGQSQRIDQLFQLILAKIRTLASQETFREARARKAGGGLIAIGASTGGAEAIETLLVELPSTMPPIVISQHMPPRFTKTFAERLNGTCKISVKEAADGDMLIPGQAYIAPGGFHMAVRRRGSRYYIQCSPNTGGSPVCPNIDTLFESVAQTSAADAIGVLLTGMGRDGAEGLKKMRLAGSATVGQDAESSVIYGMPRAAYEIGAVEQQLALGKIPKWLTDWAWR